MDRAKNIPSTEEEVSRETERVAKVLVAYDYPANFIHNGRPLNRHQAMNKTDPRLRCPPLHQRIQNIIDSERVTNVLRGFDIMIKAAQSLFPPSRTNFKEN